MMRNQTIQHKLIGLITGIHKYGDRVTYRGTNAIAYPFGGSWVIAKARHRGLIRTLKPKASKKMYPSQVELTDAGKAELKKLQQSK